MIGIAVFLNDGTGVGGYTGPQVGALLGDAEVNTYTNARRSRKDSRSVDGGTLHLTLRVDDDTGIVLEVEEDTVPSSPWLSLSADDGGHDLLSQLGLSLLDGSHDHVTGGGSGESVESGTEANDGDNVEVWRQY